MVGDVWVWLGRIGIDGFARFVELLEVANQGTIRFGFCATYQLNFIIFLSQIFSAKGPPTTFLLRKT